MLKRIIALIILSCLLILGQKSYALSYDEVDAYAKDIPAEHEKSLSKLVRYLIAPFPTNDELKSRAIYAWIVYHIDYDLYKKDVIVGDKKTHSLRNVNSGDIFETRVGVCEDIADLFLRMANKAGLKAEKIHGWAGQNLTKKTYQKNRHAWNAVYIKHKWFLIDATWGMQGDYTIFEDINKERDHKNAIRQRRKEKQKQVNPTRSINNMWFLTPPEIMIKTHIPQLEKWQLTHPTKSINTLLRDNEI